jgi:hypothetical protein
LALGIGIYFLCQNFGKQSIFIDIVKLLLHGDPAMFINGTVFCQDKSHTDIHKFTGFTEIDIKAGS